MVSKSIDITISRSVDDVFAFLTDASNHTRWDSSSVEMEQLEEGAWRTGMTFREVRRIGPRQVEIRSRIAELRPNESMDIESITGPPFNGHWRFSQQESGTRLRWTGELALAGPARLLSVVPRFQIPV